MQRALRFGPLLLCLTAFPALLFAAGHQTTEKKESKVDSQAILREGIRELNNSQYDAAETLFKKCRSSDPDEPLCELELARAKYFRWRSEYQSDAPSIRGTKEIEYQEFLAIVYDGISKSQKKMAKGERSDFCPCTECVEAYLHMTLGVMQYNNESLQDTIASGRRIVELVEKPQYQDAKYFLGLTNYSVSFVPWAIRLLKLRGVPHDRDEGLRLIAAASRDNSGIFADDIRLMMFRILINKKIKDKDRAKAEKIWQTNAEALFRELYEKYPQNEDLQKYLKNAK